MTNPVRLGIVAIGRNEGTHLRDCLASCTSQTTHVVYVDSGSSDGSLEIAERIGVTAIALDPSQPFSAARARNEGFAHLRAMSPDIEFAQFIDGDCALAEGWCQASVAIMDAHPEAAIVCGRLREKHPEASVYNRLCDLEWHQQPGETDRVGGIFMVRAQIFADVEGFNTSVVAGEEPEMCLRIRRIGCKILRIGEDMAWHDAAMMEFGQWHRRMVRSGHAYAQGAALHGLGPEKFCLRECASIWLWALALPLLLTSLAILASKWFALGFLAYALQTLRTARGSRHLADRSQDAWIYAVACMVAKFPELVGQWTFMTRALRGKKPTIIEHKLPPSSHET